MGYPSIEEIKEVSKEWRFINELPNELEGFTKTVPLDIKGNILTLCSYTNAAIKGKVDIIYTGETFDYILERALGFNIYRDIRFIYKEKDIFAAKVKPALPTILKGMEDPSLVNLGEMVAKKQILNWEYGNNLPEKIGAFELYIKPSKAIEHINGSIILLDYSDFIRKDQFLVYYNRLRDQFFGELKIAGVFRDTKDFDAKNLTQLQENLEKHLVTTLERVTNGSHEI